MHRIALRACLATFACLIPAAADAAMPDRMWGTYFGGPGVSEIAFAVTFDGAGDLYVCGYTSSTTGIATPGVHQTDHGGGNLDAFVVKFSAGGDRIWSTYIGGEGEDTAWELAVDDAGATYVAGQTSSTTGIATPGALQEAKPGATGGFVVKLDADGKRLWGTYVGGPGGNDFSYSVLMGPDDSVYVGGYMAAAFPFPLPGAYDPTFTGPSDAYVLRLTPGGALTWGTYIGGTGSETRPRFAIRDDILVAALSTNSPGLATPGVFDESLDGSDSLLARFKTNGDLQWATYFLGESISVALAPDGGVAVAGFTDSPTGIASPGAHQEIFGGGPNDGFVARFEADGTRRWATYVGGGGQDITYTVKADPADNVVLFGYSSSASGIATPGAYQAVKNGFTDAIIVKFDPEGVRRWGTYYGGPGSELGYGGNLVGVDSIMLVGYTESLTGIATPDAFQPALSGTRYVFLARFTQGQGNACASDEECEAGFCVDGVCCDSACGGDSMDCQVCSVAEGAVVDGMCAVAEAGVTCRPAISECDTSELCDGGDPLCPTDITAPDGTACANGLCSAGLCSAVGSVPQLDWSTYAGAGGDESGGAVAVDEAGNIYLVGTTTSLSGLATPGTHQTDFGGGPDDAFLLKFAADGQRIWGTYLGGPGSDSAVSLAVDDLGNVIVVGATTSASAIATPDGLQPDLIGARDGFAVLFTPDGVRVWGTYLGSATAGEESAYAAAFDDTGDIYITGDIAAMFPFPLPGPHDVDPNGQIDAYLLRLAKDGSLMWGTYYGGAGDDHGRSVAVDAAAGIVTLAGTTGSPADIATPGAFDESLDGPSDGFAVRFDTAGVRAWGTYLGDDGTDSGRGVTLAVDGSISVVGATDSATGIATADAHQNTIGGGRDAMVVRLDATGARTWATYYGGAGDDIGTAIDLDLAGELVLTGTTTSATGISSPDALHADPLGGVDIFVVKLGPAGERRWGTYYGGAFAESVGPASIVAGGPGSLYLAGTTSSSPGIATMDALFQPEFGGGGSDVFLAHLLTYVQGDTCSDGADCTSGFCVDGVCCDSACGGGDPGDCQACSVANGGAVDGTCSDVADETPCDAGLCQAGECTPDAPTTSDTSTGDADSDSDSNSNSDGDADSNSGTGGDADSNPATVPTTGSSTPTGGDASTAQDESGSGSDTAGQNDDGCGCATSSSPQHLALAALALLGLRRRRR